jgi:hypothetical protein
MMQTMTMWRVVGCSLAMLLLLVLLSAGGSETQAGGAARFYQVATPALTIITDPIYHNPQPAFSLVQDVDPDLWSHLRPGVLVRTRFPDPFGLFESAIARIRTATFSLAPTLGCSLHLDLWALEASHA